MMSDTLSPFGPSETYVCPPGYHPSIGHHGRILRYFWTISPWSLITMRTDSGPEAMMPRMMAIGMIKMDRKSVVTRLNFSW